MMREGCGDLFEETKWLEENVEIDDRYRTVWHLMPPVGWLNDPNGLCEYNGCYHIFFQYTPEAASGEGYRGWGHYTSEDLLHFRYEGLAVAPDTAYDRDGAYSGSALIEDGRMYLYYTGNVKEPGEHDYILNGRGANVILVEAEDGFQMGEKRLLLTNDDYPEDYSCHVRDPKVWRENGVYYMVLGGRTRENQGKVLVYRSENKVDWRIVNQVTTEEVFGYMWECPDYFAINGKGFLSVSPQGVEAEEFRYQNVYQAGYFKLEGDIDDKACKPYDFREWDMGFDFYAPQTFVDGRGRRLLYGWAGLPDAPYTNPTVKQGWQHCLTMPREITEKNGVLCQNPIEEMKSLRGNRLSVPEGEWIDTPKAYELSVSKAEGDHIGAMKITLCGGLTFFWDGSRELCLKFDSPIGGERTERKALLNKLSSVRMFVDVSIAEIFINHGELTFTTRLYPENYNLKIEAEDTQNILWESDLQSNAAFRAVR